MHLPTSGVVFNIGMYSKDPQESCSDGTVRLAGGAVESSGRVEVCLDSQWGTICDDSWDNSEATVVCNQLQYDTPGT